MCMYHVILVPQFLDPHPPPPPYQIKLTETNFVSNELMPPHNMSSGWDLYSLLGCTMHSSNLVTILCRCLHKLTSAFIEK